MQVVKYPVNSVLSFCVPTVASLSSPVDDGSLSATATPAENASSDHANQSSQSEENLDAKVER